MKKSVILPELPQNIDEDHRRFYNEILEELENLRRDAASILDYYTTGWLENEIGGASTPDWTNVHLGDDPSQDSNVQHNLNAPLSDLIIKVLFSTDGTDDNSWELIDAVRVLDTGSSTNEQSGISILAVDENTIKVQTGTGGVRWITDVGSHDILAAQSYYYKIEVYKLK